MIQSSQPIQERQYSEFDDHPIWTSPHPDFQLRRLRWDPYNQQRKLPRGGHQVSRMMMRHITLKVEKHLVLRKNVCRKVLEKWLGPSDNWEEQFDSIDMTNKKGEDAVLFVVNDQLTYLMTDSSFCGD